MNYKTEKKITWNAYIFHQNNGDTKWFKEKEGKEEKRERKQRWFLSGDYSVLWLAAKPYNPKASSLPMGKPDICHSLLITALEEGFSFYETQETLMWEHR